MSTNDNDFFGHLNDAGSPTPRGMRRPTQRQRKEDFGSVPDPFGGDSDEVPQAPPTPRPQPPKQSPPRGAPQTQGPGLSPGAPKRAPRSSAPGGSDVVLTPSGLQRRVSASQVNAPQPAEPASPEDLETDGVIDAHEASRQRNEDADFGWEEYAAGDFPAMAAEDFGVKTKQTPSGRVVPVAVRSDLTDEAIEGQSIKGKGGGTRRPRPAKKTQKDPPRSLLGRIGNSLRLTRTDVEGNEDEEEELTSKGFAKSGSQPKRGRKKKRSPARLLWDVTVEIGKIFLLVLLLRAYVVQISVVEGPSMQPTLATDERLIVERVTPLMQPTEDTSWKSAIPDFLRPEYHRGDIVVVRSPEDPGVELVKRLIALPGDTIKFENGKLWLRESGGNDFKEVNESYLGVDDLKNPDGTFRSYDEDDLPGELINAEELTVPKERIFVMGDNRPQSNDSRRWLEIDIGRSKDPKVDKLWLHYNSIEGRVVFRVWPLDRIWPPVK